MVPNPTKVPIACFRWSLCLVGLLIVASCKTRPAADAAAPAADIHVLYNEWVRDIGSESPLLPIEFPPVVLVPDWETWIADERNVEFALDWNGMDEDDYFDRNQFRLDEGPQFLKIRTTDHVSSYPTAMIMARQLPSVQGDPVLGVAARTSARYQGEDAAFRIFIRRKGKWETAPDEIFALPGWNRFFPDGTDWNPLLQRAMIAMEVDLSDAVTLKVKPLNRQLVDCEGEEAPLIEVSSEEETTLCALISKMGTNDVSYHWSARKCRWVMDQVPASGR